MSVNRGKQFEEIIQKSFEAVEHTVVARLHDQTNGYAGSKNPCDFLIYHKPVFLAIECKSVHGNTLSISSNPKPDKDGKLHGFYGNISDFQWEKLSEMSKVPGVVAGVMCWWVDKDITRFIPIQVLETLRECFETKKSIRFDEEFGILMKGKKKRVFFDYDINQFFEEVGEWLK
jgi:penicillin-binding protein-related factor A (putative recombinase)